MLKNVQTVCLIVRGARSTTRSVARCIHLLKGAQAPLSGLVLNRMPLRRSMGYGYYKYSPYYDYRLPWQILEKGRLRQLAAAPSSLPWRLRSWRVLRQPAKAGFPGWNLQRPVHGGFS